MKRPSRSLVRRSTTSIRHSSGRQAPLATSIVTGVGLTAAGKRGHAGESRGAATGAATGALIGSFLGPVGALVGGGVGGLIGFHVGGRSK